MYIPNLMMAMLLDENPFEKVAEPIVKLLNLAVTPPWRLSEPWARSTVSFWAPSWPRLRNPRTGKRRRTA